MTDQELQLLIKNKEDYEKKFSDCEKQLEIRDNLRERIAEIEREILKEELTRETERSKDRWIRRVKQFLRDDSETRCKKSQELWIVTVGNKSFKSDKGKYTWTSYNRAFSGICDYLYYHCYDVQRAIHDNKLDLEPIVQSLVDDEYIKIIKVV